MVKCTECGTEIIDEAAPCPKCEKYTIIKFTGTVVKEPETVNNNSGENFIYFDVDTGKKVINCEIKQGYESHVPVIKGDNVTVECKKFKERIVGLRVTKLFNNSKKVTYNFTPGCLLPVVVFIGSLLLFIITI